MFEIIFFIIGLLRFYFNFYNIDEYNLFVTYFILIFVAITISFNFFLFRDFENTLLPLTGIIIFFPICFVEKPIHGIVMGVTMHYVKYLSITYKSCKKKEGRNFK